MSTAVASAPAIGVRNGNLMHGQRLSHARRVAVGARPGRVAPRTMAFIPKAFTAQDLVSVTRVPADTRALAF